MPLLSLQELLMKSLAQKTMLLVWEFLFFYNCNSVCLYFLNNRLTQWKLIILLGQRPLVAERQTVQKEELLSPLCPQGAEWCQLNHPDYFKTVISEMMLYVFSIVSNTIGSGTKALHILSYFLTFDYSLPSCSCLLVLYSTPWQLQVWNLTH